MEGRSPATPKTPRTSKFSKTQDGPPYKRAAVSLWKEEGKGCVMEGNGGCEGGGRGRVQ